MVQGKACQNSLDMHSRELRLSLREDQIAGVCTSGQDCPSSWGLSSV